MKQYFSSKIRNKAVVPTTLIVLTLLAWLWLTSPLRVTGAQPTQEPTMTETPSVRLIIASSFGTNMLECARADCETVEFLDFGAELELIDNKDGWYKVRTANGSIGYVPDFLVALPVEATPTLAPLPTAIGCAPQTGWANYIVQPGDTLAGIAQRAGTSPEQLVQTNCLPNANILVVGQSLLVPSPLESQPIIPSNLQPAPAVSSPISTIVVPQNTLVSPTNVPPISGPPTAAPTIIFPRMTAIPRLLPTRGWILPTSNAATSRNAP